MTTTAHDDSLIIKSSILQDTY